MISLAYFMAGTLNCSMRATTIPIPIDWSDMRNGRLTFASLITEFWKIMLQHFAHCLRWNIIQCCVFFFYQKKYHYSTRLFFSTFCTWKRFFTEWSYNISILYSCNTNTGTIFVGLPEQHSISLGWAQPPNLMSCPITSLSLQALSLT